MNPMNLWSTESVLSADMVINAIAYKYDAEHCSGTVVVLDHVIADWCDRLGDWA